MLEGDIDASTITGVLPVANGGTGSSAGASSGFPAGSVIYHAANTAPSGFLKADGATVSRSTYSDLFTAIGTTYGAGNGSTTFLVPDLRGEFMRGWDDSRGVDGSRAFGSAQADQMEAHSHITGHLNHVSHTRTYGGSAASGSSATGGDSASRYAANTSTVGGTGNSSETRPRNVALLACIKF